MQRLYTGAGRSSHSYSVQTSLQKDTIGTTSHDGIKCQYETHWTILKRHIVAPFLSDVWICYCIEHEWYRETPLYRVSKVGKRFICNSTSIRKCSTDVGLAYVCGTDTNLSCDHVTDHGGSMLSFQIPVIFSVRWYGMVKVFQILHHPDHLIL